MTEQRTEYGWRGGDGRFHWHGTFDLPDDEIEQWRAAGAITGRTPIRRTVTYGPVEVVPEPLVFPTTPGSVILATIHGLPVAERFALAKGTWVRVNTAARYEQFEITLIEVKYDAGKEAEQ